MEDHLTDCNCKNEIDMLYARLDVLEDAAQTSDTMHTIWNAHLANLSALVESMLITHRNPRVLRALFAALMAEKLEEAGRNELGSPQTHVDEQLRAMRSVMAEWIQSVAALSAREPQLQ